jgi:ATP-dependent Zn protease
MAMGGYAAEQMIFGDITTSTQASSYTSNVIYVVTANF